MKNKFLVLTAFFVFTSFGSSTDSQKFTVSPIDIEENKMCKVYKEELLKFLGVVIKLPVRLNQYPPFNFERIPQKGTGRDLLRFKYNGGTPSQKYQVEIGKQLNTTDGTKIDVGIMPKSKKDIDNSFITFVCLPFYDFKNIEKVEDIYKDSNAGLGFTHRMKLVTYLGEVITKPIGLLGNDSQPYDSWLLECFEDPLEDRLTSMSGSIAIPTHITCVCAYNGIVINKGQNCACTAGGEVVKLQAKDYSTIIEASKLTNFLKEHGPYYKGPLVRCKNGSLIKGFSCRHNGRKSTEECPIVWIRN